MSGHAHTLDPEDGDSERPSFHRSTHHAEPPRRCATIGGQAAFNSIINEMHEIDTTFESASALTSAQPVTMSGACMESNFRFFIIVVSTVSASGQSSSKFDFFSSCLEH